MPRYLTLAATSILFAPEDSQADSSGGMLDLTGSFAGIFSITVFIVAYLLVMSAEYTDLRKSKPVILATGIIWADIALMYSATDHAHLPELKARESLLEYAVLALFLLLAMTYVNAMEERRVFEALQSPMVRRGLSLRQIFWFTGALAVAISPIADNLTTALLMCAVIIAVTRFIGIGCVNIVVAANAGGAVSQFGDITTLMVWQKVILDVFQSVHSLARELADSRHNHESCSQPRAPRTD